MISLVFQVRAIHSCLLESCPHITDPHSKHAHPSDGHLGKQTLQQSISNDQKTSHYADISDSPGDFLVDTFQRPRDLGRIRFYFTAHSS